MSGEVLILHIFNIHIYLWYHQRLVYGYGLPNGLPSVLMRCLVRFHESGNPSDAHPLFTSGNKGVGVASPTGDTRIASMVRTPNGRTPL
jgi:hypothetical protein